MDVGYSEKGLQDLSDLQMEDGSTSVEELDLNFVVNKEENAKDNVNEDLARSNNLNEQGSSPLADFRYNEISGTCSPIQTEFDHNDVTSATKSVYDQERLQSPSKDNHYQAEREEFFGSYLYKSSSQVKEETLHHVIETEVPAHSGEFFSVEDASQGEAIGDGRTSPAHDELEKETFSETSQYELTSPEPAYKQVEEEVSNLPTEQLHSSPRLHFSDNETKSKNIYYSTNFPTESRKLDMPHSDWHSPKRTLEQSKSTATVVQMSVSRETSPCKHQSPSSQKPVPSQQGLQDLSYSSRSQGKKRSSSPKKSDLGKNVCSGRQDSASPRGSLRGSQHMDGSSKHVSSSLRKHYSPLNHRRRDRSVSRSPIRQRDSSSGYKRDYRNRSRSRSPYTRDHYRRSPRRRYSPRRRSPPSSYHSHRRSPKRRPWSPPPNRSTGIGKPGRNLFVAGFSFLTTERDLERKFARFGRVRDVRIVRDKRSGDSRGFGFLTLERDEEADAAIRALDKTEWNGRIVLVEKSKSH